MGRQTKLVRVIRLIRILKLARLAHIQKFFNSLREMGISSRMLRLTKLFSQLLLLGHLLGCGFFYLASLEKASESNACDLGMIFCKTTEGKRRVIPTCLSEVSRRRYGQQGLCYWPH